MINLIVTEKIKNQIARDPEGVNKIINTSGDIGICITNSDAKFVTVNDAYTRIYGFDKEELVGKDFTVVVPDENKEKMQVLHKKFIRDKKEISRDWEVQNKHGELMTISVDTGYSEDIFDKTPHKITFVQKES